MEGEFRRAAAVGEVKQAGVVHGVAERRVRQWPPARKDLEGLARRLSLFYLTDRQKRAPIPAATRTGATAA